MPTYLELRPIDLDEALNLKLDGQKATLKSALDKVEFDLNLNPTDAQRISLRSFLLLDEKWPINSYPAAEFLTGTPRQIHDTAMLLEAFGFTQTDYDTKARKQNKYGIEFLTELSKAIVQTILEDWQLDGAIRDRLAKSAQIGFDQTIRIRELVSSRIDFTWSVQKSNETSFPSPTRSSSSSENTYDQPRLEYSLRSVWAVAASLDAMSENRSDKTWSNRSQSSGDEESAAERIPAEIPGRVIGGLSLLTDVAIALWGGYLGGATGLFSVPESSVRSLNTWGCTAIQLDFDPNNGRRLNLAWPFPTWQTLRQVYCFDAIFKNLTKDGTSPYLGDAWLESILRTVQNQPIRELERPSSQYIETSIVALINEKPYRIMRRNLRIRALAAIGLAFAPEYYLPFSNTMVNSSAFNSLLDVIQNEEAITERIRQTRAANLRAIRQSESYGSGAFHLMAAISPEYAIEILKDFDERMSRKESAIDPLIREIVTDNPHREHPINKISKLCPVMV